MARGRTAVTGFTAGRTITLASLATTQLDTGTGGAGSPLGASTAPGIAAPVLSAPAVSGTGGTFAAATYYWKVSTLSGAGETLPSNEVNAAIALNGSATLTWTSVSGATGYKLYRGTATNTENVLVATLTATGVTYAKGATIPSQVVARLRKANSLLSRRLIIPANAIYPKKYSAGRMAKPQPTAQNAAERRNLGA